MVFTSLRLIHSVAVGDVKVKTTAADIVNFSKYIVPEINVYCALDWLYKIFAFSLMISRSPIYSKGRRDRDRILVA